MLGTSPGSVQLGHNDVRANMEVGKCVRPGNKLEQRSEGKREGSWGGERQRERQPICLGDDSPMLGIYSIRREGGRCGGAGAKGQAVWEAARTASSHHRQGVVEAETETTEIKHHRKKGGRGGIEKGGGGRDDTEKEVGKQVK